MGTSRAAAVLGSQGGQFLTGEPFLLPSLWKARNELQGQFLQKDDDVVVGRNIHRISSWCYRHLIYSRSRVNIEANKDLKRLGPSPRKHMLIIPSHGEAAILNEGSTLPQIGRCDE